MHECEVLKSAVAAEQKPLILIELQMEAREMGLDCVCYYQKGSEEYFDRGFPAGLQMSNPRFGMQQKQAKETTLPSLLVKDFQVWESFSLKTRYSLNDVKSFYPTFRAEHNVFDHRPFTLLAKDILRGLVSRLELELDDVDRARMIYGIDISENKEMNDGFNFYDNPENELNPVEIRDLIQGNGAH